jgi:FKBP-type peptidyl-prolyl cis-trans isomerase SlyD
MSDDVVCDGKYVTLSYTIVDPQGTVVEHHDLPIGYVYGSDTQLIGNLDKAIVGRREGEEVELTIPPEEGFGERIENLTFTDDINNVPEEFRRIGAEVQMQNDRGEARTFYVTRIEDGKLTVDGNHPLAGKELQVTVKIHEVRDTQPGEERTTGIHAINMAGPSSIN